MPESPPDRPREEHPILAGVVALVGVGIAVGLVLGLVVLAGTKLIGLGGDSQDASASSRASMYLPKPVKTSAANEPQITLAPGTGTGPGSGSQSDDPSDEPTASKSPMSKITLSASATAVSPMEQFLLAGEYPQGEGAILTVQRFEDGGWRDFPATGSVQGGSFQIPVQASLPGVNRFRVVDSDSALKSEEVRVAIGG